MRPPYDAALVLGVELDADSFDRMHRGAHYLLDIRPAGRWPAEYFYYAGGVPRIKIGRASCRERV